MRKYILIMSVLIVCSGLFAQEPISIRSHSLGNIIQDDWDLIYDPIELRFVDGTHFFTNLSDFNSSYEDTNTTWKEQNTPFLKELPLGLSFKNPFVKNLKHSFLIRLRDSKESENANAGKGEYEVKSANYYDTDADGLYDNKRLFTGKYINYDISKRTAFILNNNYIYGDYTIGLKFAMDNQKTEKDEANRDMGIWDFGGYLWGVNAGDYGFDETTTNYLMEEEYSDYAYSEKGKFSTTNETSNVKFNIAVMKQFEFKKIKPELRLDIIHQNLVNGKEETDDFYSGSYTELGIPDSLGNQDEENGTITDYYKRTMDEDNGSATQIGFSIKNVFDKRKERKNCGFWELGFRFGFSSGDYESSKDDKLNYEQNMDYADTSYVNWNRVSSEHTYVNDKGDYDGSNANLYGKLHIPFSELINFGIGAFYDYQVMTRETDYIEETNNRTEYTEGGSFDDGNDSIRTENSKLTADRTYEKQIYEYRIPVGLEFRMPKKDLSNNDAFGLRNFSFRIGTTFISTTTIVNDKKQITDSYPYTTVTEYGDGDVIVNTDDNYYASTSEHSEDTVGKKIFSGGIGYNHSDNLKINLGGYIDEHCENYFIGISFSVRM